MNKFIRNITALALSLVLVLGLNPVTVSASGIDDEVLDFMRANINNAFAGVVVDYGADENEEPVGSTIYIAFGENDLGIMVLVDLSFKFNISFIGQAEALDDDWLVITDVESGQEIYFTGEALEDDGMFIDVPALQAAGIIVPINVDEMVDMLAYIHENTVAVLPVIKDEGEEIDYEAFAELILTSYAGIVVDYDDEDGGIVYIMFIEGGAAVLMFVDAHNKFAITYMGAFEVVDDDGIVIADEATGMEVLFYVEPLEDDGVFIDFPLLKVHGAVLPVEAAEFVAMLAEVSSTAVMVSPAVFAGIE